MADAMPSDEAPQALQAARQLVSNRDVRAAINLLTSANRTAHDSRVEQALVQIRRDEGVRAIRATLTSNAAPGQEILPTSPGEGLFEIDATELTPAAFRAGLAQSGCVLVRGLVPPERTAHLRQGIDQAIAAHDEATAGNAVDPAWYTPGSMPDRVANGLSEAAARRFLRERGGLWTTDSPRMLFELLETVDAIGMGHLITEALGERPLLSATKCTLRRVPHDLVVPGGWHQDGAFLGSGVGAFNFWLALSDCGRDAPGLDLLPKRVGRVIPSDDDAHFDWSLSDRAVLEVADGTPIVRPAFERGDALLFDQFLVHRTAVAADMTRERHAIESWFFAPSAYPEGQVPILY